MKVVELEWGFMTSTVMRPMLSNGTLVAGVYFSKGEGHVNGRFPKIYGVVTDDLTVTHETGRSAEIGGLPWHRMAEVYTVGTRDEESAKKLAEKMAANMRPQNYGTIYVDRYHVRFSPKLEEGMHLILKDSGKPEQKVVVVRSNRDDSDRCAGCPFKGNCGCNAPTSPFIGRSAICGKGPDSESFLRLKKEMDIKYVAAIVEDPEKLRKFANKAMPNVYCDFSVLRDSEVHELPPFIGERIIFSAKGLVKNKDTVALIGDFLDPRVVEYLSKFNKHDNFIPVSSAGGRWFHGSCYFGDKTDVDVDVHCRIGALVEFADGRLEWVFQK